MQAVQMLYLIADLEQGNLKTTYLMECIAGQKEAVQTVCLVAPPNSILHPAADSVVIEPLLLEGRLRSEKFF